MRNTMADSEELEELAPEVRVGYWGTQEDFILAQSTTVLWVNGRGVHFPVLYYL